MAEFKTSVRACAGALGLKFDEGVFPDLGPYFRLTGADGHILLVSPKLDILAFWLDGFAHGVAASQAGAAGSRARAAVGRAVISEGLAERPAERPAARSRPGAGAGWRSDELDGES